MPICTTGPGPASRWAFTSRSAKSAPRCAVTVHPATSRRSRSAPTAGVQVTGQSQVAVRGAGGLGGCPQRVGQGRGGDARRRCMADPGAEPGLGLPRDRGLGHHQHPHQSSTFQKSWAARAVPSIDPDTFERVPCGSRVVGDVVLDHPPAGTGRLLQQLHRIPEPSVARRPGPGARCGGRLGSGRCRGPGARRGGAATPPRARCRAGRARARHLVRPGAVDRRRGPRAPPPPRPAAAAGRRGRTTRRRP